MSAGHPLTDQLAQLRRRAEALVDAASQSWRNDTLESLQHLVYELKVQQVERELAHQRDLALYDSAPVGYLTLDEDGLITAANLTGAALLAVSRTDLLGERFSRFVAPQEQDAYHFYSQRLFKVTTLQQSVICLVKADGSRFEAQLTGQVVRVVPTADRAGPGPPQQSLIIFMDITRERQAEAALRASEARLDGIISTATDAIITVNAAQHIILFNAAAEQMFGYRAKTVIGQPLGLLLPARFRAAHVQNVRFFDQTGITARAMGLSDGLWGRRADGDEFPIEAMISQVDVSGQKFFTAIVRDITERRRVEREKAQLLATVRQLAARLADTEATERKQLAQELHDQVGQNLTGLDLNLNILRGRIAAASPELSTLQPLLDDSLALVAQTARSIRDVMAHLYPAVLDEYGLVAAVRWYGTQLAARANFEFILQGEELTPRLTRPVEQALFRIAQEALTNVTRHAQANQVTGRVETEPGLVRLVIADDGVGFVTTPGEPGGRQSWGLMIMAERSAAVGGQFRIESQPGQGTQVIVEVVHDQRDGP